MNAHTFRTDCTQTAASAAVSALGQAEGPLGDIEAICYALRLIADGPEVEGRAKSAIYVMAEQIEQYAAAATELCNQASSAVHPLAYPKN